MALHHDVTLEGSQTGSRNHPPPGTGKGDLGTLSQSSKNQLPRKEDLIEKLYDTTEMDILSEKLKGNGKQNCKEAWTPFYQWAQGQG